MPTRRHLLIGPSTLVAGAALAACGQAAAPEGAIPAGRSLTPATLDVWLWWKDPVEPLQVGAGSKRQVEVNAQAVAAGTVFVRAQLRTPAGREYGQPVQLQIRITEYGTVALYITLSAAALLFLTAGVQVVRRVLRARRTG